MGEYFNIGSRKKSSLKPIEHTETSDNRNIFGCNDKEEYIDECYEISFHNVPDFVLNDDAPSIDDFCNEDYSEEFISSPFDDIYDSVKKEYVDSISECVIEYTELRMTSKATEKFYKRLKKTAKRAWDYDSTEAGFASFVFDVLHKNIKYDAANKVFYFFNGVIWVRDVTDIVRYFVSICMTWWRDKILSSDDIESDYYIAARKCCDNHTFNAIMELLKSRVGEASIVGIFNIYPHLLSTPNGTVNLRTQELMKHHRDDMITQITRISFDPNAKCKKFMKFLNEIFLGNQELIEYFQLIIGYALTGENNEQTFIVLLGYGANGKSTLTKIIKYIMYQYVSTVDPAVFVKTKKRAGAALPDLATIYDKRLVFCSEWEEGERLNESRIKAVTGGDEISIRDVFKSTFTYQAYYKIFFDTNHLPEIKGTDNGIWRRLRIIPFNAYFENDKDNPNLFEELTAESEGILTFFIEGAMRYYRDYKDKNRKITPPDIIKKLVADYRLSQDTIKCFLEERTVSKDGAEIQAKELYYAYQKYCDTFSLGCENMKSFGLRLLQAKVSKKKKASGYFYQNITLCS